MGPVGPPAPIPEDKSTPSSSSPEKEESAKEDAGVTPSTGASNELEPGNASDQTVVPTVETKEVTSDSSETSITPEHPVSEAIVAPSRPPPVPPRPAPRVDNEQLIREEVELGAQQDVTEVINNVLFQAQCAIKPTKIDADGNQIDLIMDLFYGQTKSYITAMNGIRSKNEFWSDIKVDVATGSRDIYSAIDGAFDRQKVHVDGADAEQYGAISKIPPVLQIQVQRVQFDQVKKSSFKSTHHLELKETIYMDRYMDESLPDLFQDVRDKIQDLMLMKDDPEMGDDALDIDEGILTHLSNLEVMTRKELIHHQFADMKSLPYHLYAVFIHHGSVEFGHYYIYIFDFEKKIWRKYNDSEVTEVHSTAEIFSDRNIKNPPTPYFLVYLNDGLKERLAKPVCRHVEERPARTTSAADNSKSKPSRERAGDRSDVEMADLPPSYDEAQRTAPDEKVISTGPAAMAKQKLSPSPDRKRLKRKGAESEEHPTVASKN
ncbi:hypothetical protein TESG_08084 [Trichophyton tonsurans CBS 112818]|uniref:ubiquitinyl hydrolase 1 n=1 Tax=Trichophyton tonsurans (strain CBS 112818) TaxID=647933 RepID=F2SB41_TRIT1|nr:hypothetical protein TESG_08084 [Trichophyton tonsurans CBS 112818]